MESEPFRFPVRINPIIYILSVVENVYMSIKLSDFLLRNIIELLSLVLMYVSICIHFRLTPMLNLFLLFISQNRAIDYREDR